MRLEPLLLMPMGAFLMVVVAHRMIPTLFRARSPLRNATIIVISSLGVSLAFVLHRLMPVLLPRFYWETEWLSGRRSAVSEPMLLYLTALFFIASSYQGPIRSAVDLFFGLPRKSVDVNASVLPNAGGNMVMVKKFAAFALSSLLPMPLLGLLAYLKTRPNEADFIGLGYIMSVYLWLMVGSIIGLRLLAISRGVSEHPGALRGIGVSRDMEALIQEFHPDARRQPVQSRLLVALQKRWKLYGPELLYCRVYSE